MSAKQPLPNNAKKVFSGVIFDVYQWEQEMFDGSTEIFEKLKRADTVILIPLTADGKIIVTEEEQPGKAPFMSIAGGRVETGEEPEFAAKRELLEETGYQAASLELWESAQPVSKIDWTIYTYIARGCEKIAEQHLDAGEKISLHFLNFEEFIELATTEKFNEINIKIAVLEAKANPEKMTALKKLLS